MTARSFSSPHARGEPCPPTSSTHSSAGPRVPTTKHKPSQLRWMERAWCVTRSHLFWSQDKDDLALAARKCNEACPVRGACLAYVIKEFGSSQPEGIWAGLDQRARRLEVRRRQAKERRKRERAQERREAAEVRRLAAKLEQ